VQADKVLVNAVNRLSLAEKEVNPVDTLKFVVTLKNLFEPILYEVVPEHIL
jgi:hypothetical protein